MSNKKILIVGTGTLSNYGCEAIIQGSYTILKKSMPTCEIYVASENKQYDAQFLPEDIHLISYRKRFTLHRIWKGILRRLFHIGSGSRVPMIHNIGKKYDIVLSCGGDNFCEAPDKGIYLLLKDLIKIGDIASKNRKKYVLWGASIGPFRNPEAKKYVFRNLAKCDLINVREPISYQYVKDEFPDKVRLIADPAFCMLPAQNIVFQRKSDCVYIGLNISLLSIGHSISDENTPSFIEHLHQQLDLLLTNHPQYHFVCIPHVVEEGSAAQNDFVFMNDYIKKSQHSNRISILPTGIGAAKTKAYIQCMDLLIAARMHCCVGGVSAATPTLFITYSNKGIGMSYYAYQHHDYEIKTEELITDKFPQLVAGMIAKKKEIKKYLEKQQERFYKDAMKAGKYLKSI